MARLFTTTKKLTEVDSIVLESEGEESEMTRPAETVKRSFSSANPSASKLNSIWMNLSRLSPQELVAELKSIHDFLSPMDQDYVDRSELVGFAGKLADPVLIKHKDRAVRILVACAIANILRLFAPDAPYSTEQFEMIFTLFIHQLKGVSEPDAIYYNYHYFLLESLSTVKSVVLIFDLPQADLYLRELCQMALDMMHPSLLKNVRLYLLELVQTLLEESDHIPVELISELFIPHLSLNPGELTRSFVEDLIKLAAEKFQAPLAVYFSDQLARIARAEDSEATLLKLGREAHDFAVSVATISPIAAMSILTLLEEELRVEAQEIRLLGIQTISRILAHHITTLSLSSTAKASFLSDTWVLWQGRRNDKAPKCRMAWVRGAFGILAQGFRISSGNTALENHQEPLLPLLIERFQDPDERVRLTALQSFTAELMSVDRFLASSSCSIFIEAIADRCLDRKEEVKNAALFLSSDLLFHLLKGYCGKNLDLGVLIQRLLQLPFSESRIHSLAFLGYLERDIFMRLAREYPHPETQAINLSLLTSLAFTEERSHLAYRSLLKHKSKFLKGWTGLLKLIRLPETALSDVHRAKTVQLCHFLAEMMPGMSELEAQRTLLSLNTWRSAEGPLLQMLIDLAEDRCSLSLLNRIEVHIKASESLSVAQKQLLHAAIPFGSQVSLNIAIIGHLATTTVNPTCLILQDILTDFPQLFVNRGAELVEAVISSSASTSSLLALAQYSSSSVASALSADRKSSLLTGLDEVLLKLLHPPLRCSEGEGAFDCKRVQSAAQIIINLKLQSAAELGQNLIFQLASQDDDGNQVRCALAGLIGMTRLITTTTGAATTIISGLLPHFEMIFELITQRLFPQVMAEDADESVAHHKRRPKNPEEVKELMVGWWKLDGMPTKYQIAILCSRFLALFTSALIKQISADPDAPMMNVEMISSIRSLSVGFFLTHLPEIEAARRRQPPNRFFLRLQYSILKGLIMGLPDASVSDLVGPLQGLFLALQDTEGQLRYKLTTLLSRMLRARRLSDAFLPLLFFAGALEPMGLIQNTLKAMITEIVRLPNAVVALNELLPALIIYTIQHPDYRGPSLCSHEDLLRAYYEYFGELILTADNCGNIYEEASRLKFYRFRAEATDGQAQEPKSDSVNLYFASELAQEVIRSHCSVHHWPLQSTNTFASSTAALSRSKTLLPDVLEELEESEQLANIHRIYRGNPKDPENIGDDNRTESNSKTTGADGDMKRRIKRRTALKH